MVHEIIDHGNGYNQRPTYGSLGSSHLSSLQGKDLLTKLSSVTKLEKIVKKTYATTSIIDSGCFCGYYNEI
jgi:hypothetical protein